MAPKDERNQEDEATANNDLSIASERFEFDDDVDTVHFLNHGHDEMPGSWGRAIIREFRKTVGTWWFKEMINFNQKTIAVSVFIFFAAVAPAITFGAVYGRVTNDSMGAVEMLIGTAWCGIFYGLLGGMPIIINGATGPILTMQGVVMTTAQNFDVNFLTLNAWTGLWVTLFLVIAAVFDWNRFMAHATRFTDDCFAGLIASIFIIDALGSPFKPTGIGHYFDPNHSSHAVHSEDEDYDYMTVAFFSVVLCIGTTWLAFALRGLKFSAFFPNDAWRAIFADFAVVLAILTFTLIANLAFPEVKVERLNVPDSIQPTQVCCTSDCKTSYPQDCPDIEPYGRRSWFVDLFALSGKPWIVFFAAVPGLLAFILVFLDDGITWHLINHPSNMLTHGESFNYDTIILAIVLAVNSLLGLPWLVASTVPAMTHLGALAEKNEKGKVLAVQETRLTHLGIHLLILAACFALPALKLIPMPVLYGVFLFMGLASLIPNQFWQRFLMFFQQPKKYALEPFTQYMRPKRMHLYTLIQLGMFCLILVFFSIKKISILFPIVIKACIPVRMYILPRIFTNEELIMIDTDDMVVREYLAYKEQKHEPRTGTKQKLLEEEESDDEEAGSNGSEDDSVAELQRQVQQQEAKIQALRTSLSS